MRNLWRERHAAEQARRIPVTWLTKVAHLLRKHDLDASPAHIIEAVRLAETLAHFRGRSLPDLTDLNEATRAVLCLGDDLQLQLIHRELIVGEALGQVPAEAPAAPLLRDLERLQKSLRLATEATERLLELDLRRDNDLARSHLLHRLRLLQVNWGEPQHSQGARGTFRETWKLLWRPEFAVELIEAAGYGNTVVDAAGQYACERAQGASGTAPALAELTVLLDQTLLADLPHATPVVMRALQAAAALTHAVGGLMQALPPLARILRYGNVRQTDTLMVRAAAEGLATRICIGLPGAAAALDDDAARSLLGQIRAVNDAMALLDSAAQHADWRAALVRIVVAPGVHGLVAGACCRLLYDAGHDRGKTLLDAAQQLSLALSTAADPATAAAWIEGFLGDSGLVLLHDAGLWRIIAAWVAELEMSAFTEVLPLLRRAFSRFPAAERRQMGQRVAAENSGQPGIISTAGAAYNAERGAQALPLLAQLLGLKMELYT